MVHAIVCLAVIVPLPVLSLTSNFFYRWLLNAGIVAEVGPKEYLTLLLLQYVICVWV